MLITEQNQDLLMDISGMFLPDLSHTDDTFGYGKSALLCSVLLSLYYSSLSVGTTYTEHFPFELFGTFHPV
jgi:hypothetical protein